MIAKSADVDDDVQVLHRGSFGQQMEEPFAEFSIDERLFTECREGLKPRGWWIESNRSKARALCCYFLGRVRALRRDPKTSDGRPR